MAVASPPSTFIEVSAPIWAHLMLGSLSNLLYAVETLTEHGDQLDEAACAELRAVIARNSNQLKESLVVVVGGHGPGVFTALTGH
jgi:hypothetical protein